LNTENAVTLELTLGLSGIEVIVQEIQIDLIARRGFNPRKTFDPDHIRDLASSIRKDGLWNPIIVRKGSDGKYDLIAGECRVRALSSLGMQVIKANILDVDDDEANLLALKTNLMRRDLNLMEEAWAVKRLFDLGWNMKSIVKALDKSRSWVASRLKLAEKASEGLQNALMGKQLSITSAIIISDLPENLQGPVASKVIKERLDVKEVNVLVDLLKSTNDDTDIGFLLRTPTREFLGSSLMRARARIERSRKNSDVAYIDCECGTRYIVDWVNRCVVSQRVAFNVS
jgi:ParB/RepB/Spo0J family partition protein